MPADAAVLVRKLSGETICEVQVAAARPVAALKVAIAEAGGPPDCDQQLIVGHRVLTDGELLNEALAEADGQVFLVTVAGCPSCQGPCSCRLCNAAPRPGLVDYYGVCLECGKCGGHSSKCPFCLQAFPSLCALDSHVRFLHRDREASEWQTSRLEGYIRQRHLPGARRAANPEPGTFTDARTGGLPHQEEQAHKL